MRSIVDLLNAIVDNPLVDQPTRVRAGFLLWRMTPFGAFDIFDRVFPR